jgi:DNA-binding transcriptional LysR family regulator
MGDPHAEIAPKVLLEGVRAQVDELSINRAFVQVVEAGGLSAAARRMNTSVTSVARQVNSLEALLGVRLLNRTTRRQSLTEAGQDYYSRISEAIARIDDIKRDVSAFQEDVKGRLRVHLRTTIGIQVVIPALPRFLAQYPELTLDVTMTDERVDLVAHGVDLAVWLGALENSSMIARRLSPSRRFVCASPDYLARCGPLEKPEDLSNHNCLVFNAKNYTNVWRFTKDDETIDVPVSGNLRTNSGIAVLSSAIHGVGVALLQETIVQDALEKGELRHVFAEYAATPTQLDGAIYAVFPHGRRLSPKTRAFVDFLVELFRERS